MIASKALSQEQEAKILADENRKGDRSVQRVLWFPSRNGNEEIHLVLVSEQSPSDDDNLLHPFYFGAVPEQGVSRSSAVAIIRPNEVGKLTLPTGWVNWNEAKEV